MNKTVFLCALAGLGAAAPALHAQEMGRVINTTPVIQQVAVPRQVCTQQPVAQGTSGGGAVVGGLAGGAIGNQIGHGSGRAAATLLGVVGGALLGNSIEGSGNRAAAQPVCTTQTTYENRAVAYNVTYEYAGRQYTVQMAQDPGQTVPLQVTPVGATQPQQPDSYATTPAPVYQQQQPVYVQPAPVYAPAYAPVVYPAAYYRPYYPPVGVSLNFGWVGGHGHGRWR